MSQPVPRIQTYIPGLDNMLGGGIPFGSVVVLEGSPGTLKSTLAYTILYQNAIRTRSRMLYFTLEQSRKDLEEQMEGLGMSREAQGGLGERFSIVDLSEARNFLMEKGESELTTDWFESVHGQLRNFQKDFPVNIFVLDSLNALISLNNKENTRVDLYHFIRELKNQPLTTLLISEVDEGVRGFISNQIDYLVDGVIRIEANRVDEMVNMQLGVVKMRKTSHSRSYRPLIVSKGRFEIVGG